MQTLYEIYIKLKKNEKNTYRNKTNRELNASLKLPLSI